MVHKEKAMVDSHLTEYDVDADPTLANDCRPLQLVQWTPILLLRSAPLTRMLTKLAQPVYPYPPPHGAPCHCAHPSPHACSRLPPPAAGATSILTNLPVPGASVCT